MEPVQVPMNLPKGWRATSDSRGVVIDSFDDDGRMQGSVTVCEQVRGFALGVQSVRSSGGTSKYTGRGWKQKLYTDAVAALQTVWERQAARMNQRKYVVTNSVETAKVKAVQEPGYANVWSIQTETGVTVARMTVGDDAEAWAKRIEAALSNQYLLDEVAVLEWAQRHDITGTITDLRAMFNDARILHSA